MVAPSIRHSDRRVHGGRALLSPGKAREHYGYSVYQAAKEAGVTRSSIEKLEAGGTKAGRAMTVITLLKLFELYYPHCTLQDFVGKNAPEDLVARSGHALKRIEAAQIESLASRNRQLTAELAKLRDLAGPEAAQAARLAQVPAPSPDQECSTASNT